MKNREELVENYITEILETADTQTLLVMAYDLLRQDIGRLSDEELLDDIRHYYPYLLEE